MLAPCRGERGDPGFALIGGVRYTTCLHVHVCCALITRAVNLYACTVSNYDNTDSNNTSQILQSGERRRIWDQ